MLCFRCEHRAKNLETNGKHQPRCECGDIEHSKLACYMYKPTKPVTLEKWPPDDKSSQFWPAFISARSKQAEKEIEMILDAKIEGARHVRFWVPGKDN